MQRGRSEAPQIDYMIHMIADQFPKREGWISTREFSFILSLRARPELNYHEPGESDQIAFSLSAADPSLFGRSWEVFDFPTSSG